MLKTLLQTLLKAVCPQVFPGENSIDHQLQNAQSSFVAPFDGYAVCISAGVSDVAAINLVKGMFANFIPTYLDSWGAVWISCRKGETIIVSITGSGKPTLRFIETRLSEQ